MEASWVRAEIVWNLSDHCPPLVQGWHQQYPGLADLPQELEAGFMAQALPVAGSWGIYHRPFGHWRALYRWEGQRGCLAFKGSEAYTRDLDVLYDALLDRYAVIHYSVSRPGVPEPTASTTVSVLDRFLFVESKFPGVVLLSEAMAEAERSASVQWAHLQRYGCLARVPLPLVVYRVDEQVAQRVVDCCCARVSRDQQGWVHNLAAQGMAILVYWYPELPLRVSHASQPALAQGIDPASVVAGWITLVARLMGLGYAPADPRSALRGSCVEAQNLTLDGGMVDLDSLRPLDSFRNSAEIFEALERSLELLSRSIAHYLSGDPRAGGDCGPLRQEIVQICRQQGQDLPPELQEYLQAEGTYQRMRLRLDSSARLAGN